MDEAERMKGELQGLMVLMASLSHGLEHTLGRGASTITFRAGRTVGSRSEVGDKSVDLQRTAAGSDLLQSLVHLFAHLRGHGGRE